MKHFWNKNRIIVLIILLVIAAVGVFIGLKYYFGVDIGRLEKELSSISPSVTEEELEEKGYINTHGIQPSQNQEIEKFLLESKTKNPWNKVLRVYTREEGRLLVQILYADYKLGEIRTWTYEPERQALIGPDTRYSLDYRRTEENGIVTVELVNIKNRSLPVDNQILIDQVLYSYYE